jgi:hypothetical protein
VPVRITQVFRYGGVQRGGLDRLRQPAPDQLGKHAVVDHRDDIGGGVRALRLDTLGKSALDENGAGLDARFGGEGVEQRLDQRRLARRVDIDLALREGRRGRHCGEREKQRAAHTAADRKIHRHLLF